MKSNKPPVVKCCQCTRRQNLVEVDGKLYCKWCDPTDSQGAQSAPVRGGSLALAMAAAMVMSQEPHWSQLKRVDEVSE
jgi:hypothetical protein